MKQGKLWIIVSILIAVLMVAFVGTLAMPHMTYEKSVKTESASGEKVSSKEETALSTLLFVWFPENDMERAVKAEIAEKFPDEEYHYTINSAAAPSAGLTLLALAGAALAILFCTKFIAFLVPFGWSVYGIFVYFTNPFVRLGTTDYLVQLILLFAVLALSILLFCGRLPAVLKNRKEIRMQIRHTREQEAEMRAKRAAAGK